MEVGIAGRADPCSESRVSAAHPGSKQATAVRGPHTKVTSVRSLWGEDVSGDHPPPPSRHLPGLSPTPSSSWSYFQQTQGQGVLLGSRKSKSSHPWTGWYPQSPAMLDQGHANGLGKPEPPWSRFLPGSLACVRTWAQQRFCSR